MIDINLTANTLGILSLATSSLAFSPTIINLLKFTDNHYKFILQVARLSIMVTICLGLIHGLLMTQRANIDFYNINTYWVYAGGLFAFNLFVFLGFAFAEFKSDIKKLNYLNYAVIFLLACHVWQKIMPSF